MGRIAEMAENSLPGQTPPERGHRLRRIQQEYEELRPSMGSAIRADARMTARARGDVSAKGVKGGWRDVLWLIWQSDDFLAVVLYRLRTRLRVARVPILPRLLHRVCAALFGIRIGDDVVVGEGLCILHGNVVIDGVTALGRRVSIAPWVTIGLQQGHYVGPRIGDDVFIGTGAKILGPICIGDGARIGAGAVVLSDVASGTAVAGVPARPTRELPAEEV
jgi:serine O-acetyltransferase